MPKITPAPARDTSEVTDVDPIKTRGSGLTWRLMRLLPALLADEAFAPLRRFLADDSDLRKRHQLAERLADLFDQYQVYRADWLADWAAGSGASARKRPAPTRGLTPPRGPRK